MAIVVNVGAGCGGRGSVGHEMESQGGFPVSDHSMRTNGAEACGKTVWSWHPLLVSSRRRRVGPTGLEQTFNPPMTEARTNSSPGRSRHKPQNHCAGKAGVFPLNLYARVRILFVHLAHETAGAARTRSSLRPSLLGETSFKPRAQSAPREREDISGAGRCLPG